MNLSAGFLSMPGGSEWIVIFLVMLIIFGPKSLPRIGQAIGRGIKEFKDASEGITRAIEDGVNSSEPEHHASKEEHPSTMSSEAPEQPAEHHTD